MTKQATSSPNDTTTPVSRLPLRGWALELARRWNGGSYSLFVLHGNIFDLFPLPEDERLGYVPLKLFLSRRLFPERSCLLFYDISGGLTFGSPEMKSGSLSGWKSSTASRTRTFINRVRRRLSLRWPRC